MVDDIVKYPNVVRGRPGLIRTIAAAIGKIIRIYASISNAIGLKSIIAIQLEAIDDHIITGVCEAP